jgi:hypothetical protein
MEMISEMARRKVSGAAVWQEVAAAARPEAVGWKSMVGGAYWMAKIRQSRQAASGAICPVPFRIQSDAQRLHFQADP